MLLSLTAHIIITVCCLWSGYLFYKFLPGKNEARPVIFNLISGLILLTTFAQIIALFFPIGLSIQLVLAIILLISILFKQNEFKSLLKKIISEIATWSPLSLILFFIVWGVIILMNAGPVIMDDTESYHIQMIKWIQEYGSVPGLVNLHERFGFNSSWFSSVALFNLLPGTTSGFTVLNSALSIWLCYWFIAKFNQLQKENGISNALSLLVVFVSCLAIWPLVRGNAATANYDFITTCIVFIFFAETFLSPAKKFSPGTEWIIWPVYLFTVRIINFPFLVLSLLALILLIKQKKNNDFFLSIAFCLFLIIPFLVRNIIIAGSPFYPSTFCDWINVDWKPDPQMTERLLEYIKYYNRISTGWLDIEQTKALGSNWIPSWFRYLFTYDKLLVVAGSAGLLLNTVRLFVSSHFSNNKNRLLITASIITLCCWFIISPDPRFVYGVLLFGFFLFACQLISFVKSLRLIKFLSNASLSLLILGAGFYLFSKPFKQKEYRNWVLPARLPQPPTKEIIINGITFRIPEPINNNWNARCYGTDLPCLYKIDPRLKPRGNNVRDGFRIEK